MLKTTRIHFAALSVTLQRICISLLGSEFRSMASQFVLVSATVWSISVRATLLSSVD